MEQIPKDWKARLKYGKIVTQYQHYTLLADSAIGEDLEGFDCRPGKAWIGMKIWAASAEEAVDVLQSIGEQCGFKVAGNIELYNSEPEEPPGENPCAYSINFTPYE